VTQTDLLRRPFVGFVVEGRTEHETFPSLACRCASVTGLNIPRADAKGTNKLRTDLEEHLKDLVSTHHPYVVIVALDSRDTIRDGSFEDCAQMRLHLQGRCERWLEQERQVGRLEPLPTRVVVVAQHPTFEAWLIADLVGLAKTTTVVRDVDTVVEWSNVDADVANPGGWLAERVIPGVKLKPNGALAIVRNVNVAVIEQRSRSFAKFAKEVRSAYADWATAAGLAS
jgi:hypothetical protein